MRLVIEPGRSARNYWGDLWRYRELLYFLAWRDILVRYKQTAIGVAWALLVPAFTVLAFVAFRRLMGSPQGAAPEAIVVMAAVLPWQFFANALSESSASLVGNSSLISKVYFPRLVVPIAAALTALVDFAITLALLAAVLLWYRHPLGAQLAAIPLFVLLAFVLALGLGILFAALNVRYRDFRYVVPFLVQLGLFVSPIAFTLQQVPEDLRPWLALNPLTGVIEGFRWSIVGGTDAPDLRVIAISAVVAGLVLAGGLAYFRRVERGFADVI
jgi:lipopolysaccharide transport system permease protein